MLVSPRGAAGGVTSRGALLLSLQPAMPNAAAASRIGITLRIAAPPRGTEWNGTPRYRAMRVPSGWRPGGHRRDGRILRHDNDFRAKELKKRPPPEGDPGGGAVCAADSGVGPALHRLKKN